MTRRFAIAVLLACVGASGAARPAPDPFQGRVPVTTQRCVGPFGNEALTIIDDRTLLYRPVGKRIWRNDLADRCPGLNADDILIVEPFGSQYCEHDQIRAVHRGSTIPGPICRLGKFTAYEKPPR